MEAVFGRHFKNPTNPVVKAVLDVAAYADSDKVILKDVTKNNCIRILGDWFKNGENIRKSHWNDRVLPYNERLFDALKDVLMYIVATMRERATVALASKGGPAAMKP